MEKQMTKVTRNLNQKLKKTKIKLSSARWLQRNMNDDYVMKAKLDGYRSRAAYKLCEIDDKYNFIKNSQTIIDLGSAPGSWSQVLRKRTNKNAIIFAIDIQDMLPIENVVFLKRDITKGLENIIETVKKCDLIVSDIAPNFCGIKEVDQIRVIELCMDVLDLTKYIMSEKCYFVMKTFNGKGEPDLFMEVKSIFPNITRFKPSSSRKDSNELYYFASK